MPAFTPGNLVIYRVGTGTGSLVNTGNAVFLDEYTKAGVYVQSVALPTTDTGASNALIASGTSSSEGMLTLSTDGRYLLMAGYNASPGGAVNLTTSASATIQRTVGRVDSNGNVDTTTALTDFSTGSSPRGVASTNGNDLWISGGAGSARYTTLGATTSTQLSTTVTNLRGVEIFDGQLYVSAQSGAFRLATVGSNLPATSGQTISNLPGFPTATGSPYAFFFADLDGVAGVDTVYVADDGTAPNGGGIQKWSLVSGSWAASGTILAASVRGLTGSVSGTTVTLFGTTGGTASTGGGSLYTFTDATGYNAAVSGSAITIATAGANTAFRGIAFTPVSGPTISIQATSVTHDEGDSGTTEYVFIVTRSSGASSATVNYAVTGSGGLDAIDFVGATLPSGTATFSGSDLTTTITINVAGDLTLEASETFTVTLSSPSAGYDLGTAAQSGIITDDDNPGTISVADVAVTEGDVGTTPGAFIVSRTGGTSGTVGVDYVITLPGGVGGADSADVSATLTGTVTFLDGETSKTVPFTVNGDLVNEPNETFTIALSTATGGASIGTGNATATITNDDAPPTISIGDTSVLEGSDGVFYLVFTVSLNKASLDPVTVDFATSNNSATAGSDYLALSGQVSFDPGQTSKTISVPVIGDNVPENNETLTVTLSTPSGASILDGVAAGTITNDDGPAYYALSGGSFSQNWTGAGLITADDNWSGVPHIIGYLGDIDAGSDTNVDPRTLTGAALGAIDVIANQSAATNSSGGVGEFEITNPVVGLQGSGTADAPSIVLYMNATGRSNVRLQANLRDIDGGSEDAAQQVNVQYRTSATGAWTNVTGAYFADVTTAGTATQETVLDVILPAGANNAPTLEIRIMTTNAAGSDEWVGIDDIIVSSALSGPTLSIANAAIFEGDAGPTALAFTVTRAGDSTGAVTADYSVTLGSGPFAAAAGDFAGPLTGQVAFADGVTTATITIDVQGDLIAEGDDSFNVVLANPSPGASIADGSATGTIVNDDGPPSLVTISDVTVAEGNSGSVNMIFTVTRTGGTGAFDVDFQTSNGSATSAVGPGQDYVTTSGTVNFGVGQTIATISVSVLGDTDQELSETLFVTLSNATNNALITDATGIGTIAADDLIYIHDIQGTSYYSPILAGEGISAFNTATAGSVIVRAVVTAVDNDGPRQGYYISEEGPDWDTNGFTSEGIFVMTRNDAGIGSVVSGVSVGDLVQVTAQVMEYQSFNTMPRTMLVNPTGLQIVSTGNALPTVTLTNMPNEVMTGVTPDYTDVADDFGDTFDASVYALSYFETVEGMLVTIPNMVVADGFVSTSGGDPFLQAYSLDSANADQINARGGYTIAGDPPIGPPDTLTTGDDTNNGGLVLHDGDVNPDIIELDFTGFAMAPPTGLAANATMGDQLGDVTGIIDFDFTDRKLFVTAMEPSGFVNGGIPVRETTVLGDDSRALTVATFNVENLDFLDAQSRFDDIAAAIANNLNAPDIISIEEIQDNNGAGAGDGTSPTGTDATQTWGRLVAAVNAATGANYQWVDQAPGYDTEGGQDFGNIRVGFLYNTDRVQLGDLAANATIAERRMYTDRIGDGVRDAGDLIAYSDDMLGAEISASDWAGTRRSLLGEFTFNGNKVYVTTNHWPAKGGSGEFWQFDQNLAAGDPDNSGWAQRNQVSQDVYSMMNLIQSADANAGIVAGGDFNDFYFYRPLTTVTGHTLADGTARVGGARFDNLTLTLAEAERYTYTFDGRSQAIDHVIANTLLSAVATYDVVHINTGYNAAGVGVDASPRLSDHDPALASFDYRNFSELLNGTAGADIIYGYGGNDVINGLAGADAMDGGAGNDVFFVENAGDIVHEIGGEGNDTVYASVSYRLFPGNEIETLSAADHSLTTALTLTGNEFVNNVWGNNGANVLNGGGGGDLMVGFGGDDVFFVDQTGDRVYENAGGGNDIVYSSESFVLDADSDIETLSAADTSLTTAFSLTGNGLNNNIWGNNGNNTLNGGGGADLMAGHAGNDTYFVDNAGDRVFESSGGGSDIVYSSVSFGLEIDSHVETLSAADHSLTTALVLTGNAVNNNLWGNDGANVLNGREGADVLLGLGGADTFAFTTALGGGNVDFIADFVSGVDKISLDDAIFTALGLGTLGANAFVTGTAAGDADDRIIYNSATGQLYYDVDGNGAAAAVQFATLNPATPLNATDFIVI